MPHFARRPQYLIYLTISLVVALMGAFLYYNDASTFSRFLGDFNPLIVIAISIVAGILLLYYLSKKTDFAIHKSNNFRNYLILIGVAFLFGIEVIVADIWFARYPADINIVLPQSLLFYPTIGFIVEVFFHLLPLSLGVFVLSRFASLSRNKVVWISIIFVSILEPIYQMWFASQGSLTTTVYTGVHVFLFSLAQLLIFKRFGFVSMYLFRLVFYAIWHIAWGAIRLNLFF